jgi:hypothetical protein
VGLAGEGCWLELPEAFGLGMAVAQIAEPKEGKVGEDDQEAQGCGDQEQGKDDQACEQTEARKASEAGEAIACARGLRVGERHYIFYSLDRL